MQLEGGESARDGVQKIPSALIANLPVYAFDGTTYTNYNKTTNAQGQAVFVIPEGNYRFRADKNSSQYFSNTTNHCTIPTCTAANITIPMTGFNKGGVGKLFSLRLNDAVPAPTIQSGVITTTITYTYDELYRLTDAVYSDGDEFHYEYDAVGNILTKVVKLSGITVTTTYTYDDANRLQTVNGVAQQFDANGNLINDGARTYAYDAANRLKTITQGSNVSSYSYNGLGDRVSQTNNGVTTNYSLDLNTGLTQVLGDGVNTYLYGMGRVGEQQANGFVYHLGDALGSVRQLVDASGAVQLTRSYEPYGETLSSIGSGSSVYQFTGESRDVSGLIFLRARYYNSDGRFLTKDTFAGDYNSPSTLNRWGYVQGNPINYSDPSGHCVGPVGTVCVVIGVGIVVIVGSIGLGLTICSFDDKCWEEANSIISGFGTTPRSNFTATKESPTPTCTPTPQPSPTATATQPSPTATQKPDLFKRPLPDGTWTSGYSFAMPYPATHLLAGSYHLGVDYNAPEGTFVYASADGIVRQVQTDNDGYGNYVVIEHLSPIETNKKVYTLYAHLREPGKVSVPQQAKKGTTLIGYVGHTGKTSTDASHLHFEIRKENAVDLFEYSKIDYAGPKKVGAFINNRDDVSKYFYEPQAFLDNY